MFEIRIDLDKKCVKCGKPGPAESGLCLACINKGIKKGQYDHIIKPLKDTVKAAVKCTMKKLADADVRLRGRLGVVIMRIDVIGYFVWGVFCRGTVFVKDED